MQPGEGEAENDSMVRTSYNPPGRGLGSSGGAGKRPKGLLLLVVGVVILCLFAVPKLTGGGGRGQGLRGSGRTSTLTEGGPYAPDAWDFLLIADLDKKSKLDAKTYRSVLQAGRLTRSPSSGAFNVDFGEATDLFSGHNEAGRGMELSELLTYQGSLLTVDDRTGIVFEIVEDGDGRHMAPRHVLSEGDGSVDKGMKLEWATIKDGSLVVGSFGKEYTNDDGEIVNMNNNWVIFIDADGVITREDWTSNYNKMREAVDAEFPGYMIHESGAWSDLLQKWVFLPRRISSEAYDDVKDEQMGSNTILLADEDFGHVEVRHAGELKPTHGFSSFKFVPGTNDQVVVALKSEERDVAKTQDTFIMVFTLDGEILLDETEVPGGMKFEGVEIMPVPAARVAMDKKAGGNR